MTSDGRASAIPRSTVVAVVTATTIAQVASVMGFAIFPVIAPRLAHEIGVPASMVGYQLSIGYGTAMLATSYVSSTIPRFGACRSTQVGLLLSALGMLCAITASVAAVIIASVLLGLGMSVMTPASTHLLFRFGACTQSQSDFLDQADRCAARLADSRADGSGYNRCLRLAMGARHGGIDRCAHAHCSAASTRRVGRRSQTRSSDAAVPYLERSYCCGNCPRCDGFR